MTVAEEQEPEGSQAQVSEAYYLDIHPDDVYWCMADVGWITGHSYIVYGPLALGTTTVIYEGVPNTIPTAGGRGGSRRSSG
jgi:acyl-coenzyme A synthetase/AMP-(fatty) acid ligase